jgi:hypothetical protein
MKFIVSSKVKGSLILKTLGRAVSAKSSVYVEGNDLYADDIQRAIKSKFLIPADPRQEIEVKENIINKTSEVIIINKTDRVVIVGNIPIRPNGSTIKDITEIDMNSIKQAIARNQIQVIVDVDEELFQENSPIKKSVKIADKAKNIKIEKNDTEDGESEDKIVEDEVNSVVWDFRRQKIVDPEIVPKTNQIINAEPEKKDEDVDMIDALDEVNDIEANSTQNNKDNISKKIETIQKKVTKKTSKKKKVTKASTSKKKELNDTKEKSTEDIVPALDSMGRILKNDMNHMISEEKNDISFVDKEQAKKKIDNTNKKKSGILDLDLDW